MNTSCCCHQKSRKSAFRVDVHFSCAIGLNLGHVDIRWGTKWGRDNTYALWLRYLSVLANISPGRFRHDAKLRVAFAVRRASENGGLVVWQIRLDVVSILSITVEDQAALPCYHGWLLDL